MSRKQSMWNLNNLMSVCFFPQYRYELTMLFYSKHYQGSISSFGIDRKKEDPDNAQTVTAEWIILTHLIDVAYIKYHIHAQHDVWKWSIWTGDVAQSFILWSHNRLMTLRNHHIMWIILIRLAFAFHWHPQKKLQLEVGLESKTNHFSFYLRSISVLNRGTMCASLHNYNLSLWTILFSLKINCVSNSKCHASGLVMMYEMENALSS